MIRFEWNSRLGRAFAGALFAAVLALVPACGSKDNRPLVVVDVPLGTYAGAGATVKITISLDGVQAAEHTVPSTQVAAGKIGVYLPTGSHGNATVTVAVSDASGCLIASGSSTAPVTVKAGEISTTVSITLLPAGPCVVDGSVAPPVDSGVADGPGSDAPGAVDSQPPVLDGPPVVVDVVDAQPLGPDVPVSGSDVPVLGLDASADAKFDVAIPTPDVAVDVATADLLASPDHGPDSPADAPPTTTTMNIMANCTPYTHTKKDSTGKIQDWAVYQTAFSPDGKTLISFGEDGRAKVWNVTAAGLSEPSSGLVFVSATLTPLNGAISPDGNYVAVGDRDGQMNVYDLPASLQFGAPSPKWSLPVSTLSVSTGYPDVMQFTSDNGHLVTALRADASSDPNQFVVWELGTQTVARHVDYDPGDRPMAVLPGSYTGSMWVASAANYTGDAGDASRVTLMDVAQATPSKAQFTVAGSVENMAFSPDGTALAIAFDSGEISQWDITNKSSISRLGSPLVPAPTSGSPTAYALAYTNDGKYLAAGTADFYGGATLSLVQLQQKTALQKAIDYLPEAAAFTLDGLGLAVGEVDNGVLLYCRP
jgi:WD40 repeat protein